MEQASLMSTIIAVAVERSFSQPAFRDALAVDPVGVVLARAPVDRLAADLLDRAVKLLDVLNNVSLALVSLPGWHRPALTAASCLLGDGGGAPLLHCAQFAPARRAIDMKGMGRVARSCGMGSREEAPVVQYHTPQANR